MGVPRPTFVERVVRVETERFATLVWVNISLGVAVALGLAHFLAREPVLEGGWGM